MPLHSFLACRCARTCASFGHLREGLTSSTSSVAQFQADAWQHSKSRQCPRCGEGSHGVCTSVSAVLGQLYMAKSTFTSSWALSSALHVCPG